VFTLPFPPYFFGENTTLAIGRGAEYVHSVYDGSQNTGSLL